jgi:hypothetical protein
MNNCPLIPQSFFNMSADYADFRRLHSARYPIPRPSPVSPYHPQISLIHNLRNLRTICTTLISAPSIIFYLFVLSCSHDDTDEKENPWFPLAP